MTKDNIEIIDAQENNLKHVNVSIPKGELVVFCGVSGSGKSSLAFDTIANESNRQWQENYPLFLRNKMPHYDRAKVESIENLTPAVVVDQHSIGVSSRSTVGTALDVAPLVRLLFSRCGEPSAGGSMAYSANHPMGMCPHCTGLGTDLVLKEDLLFDTTKTLREGAIRFSQFSNGWQTYLYQANPKLNADKKLADFTADEWDYLKYGERETDGSVSKKQIKVEIRSNNTGRIDKVDYEGVIPRFGKKTGRGGRVFKFSREFKGLPAPKQKFTLLKPLNSLENSKRYRQVRTGCSRIVIEFSRHKVIVKGGTKRGNGCCERKYVATLHPI